jgi:hypothetical protein
VPVLERPAVWWGHQGEQTRETVTFRIREHATRDVGAHGARLPRRGCGSAWRADVPVVPSTRRQALGLVHHARSSGCLPDRPLGPTSQCSDSECEGRAPWPCGRSTPPPPSGRPYPPQGRGRIAARQRPRRSPRARARIHRSAAGTTSACRHPPPSRQVRRSHCDSTSTPGARRPADPAGTRLGDGGG